MKIFFREKANIEDVQVIVEAQQKNPSVEHVLNYLDDYNKTLGNYVVQVDGRIHQFQKNEITWCEVLGDYTTIHLLNKSLTFRKTLSQLENDLPQNQFVRTSRSALVNLKSIKKVETSFSGNMQAILTTDDIVHISRKYWKNIKQRILDDE